MRLPVGCGWQPVMLEDGILMAEQSMTWQLKRSCDLQHSSLALTELDRRSERPDPINRLVMSALFQIFKKSELVGDGCKVNHAEERPILLSVSGYVIILGMKTLGQNLNCLPSAWVYWLCSPDVTRQMGFP